jgi:hypothetical protein
MVKDVREGKLNRALEIKASYRLGLGLGLGLG